MSTTANGRREALKTLCEGAVMVAAAYALSFLKIPIGFSFGGFGGSIDLVMIPLLIFAMRSNLAWGLGAGLIFGTLKFFFAGGLAVNWQSMLLDYSLAYMFVGFASAAKYDPKPLRAAIWGSLLGCAARFAVHFVSGVTIYAEYMPEEFMGMTMISPALYSVIYNATYMLPNTVIAVVVCALLSKLIRRKIW